MTVGRPGSIRSHWLISSFASSLAASFAWWLGTLGVSLTGPAVCNAALPVVDAVRPPGVQRGIETKVVMAGARLADAYTVLSHHDQIEIAEVRVIDDKQVEVTLRTDPQTPPGRYPLQLITRSGVANLRMIGVGALPVCDEVEPNQSFEAAQVIPLGVTVQGVIENEDMDHFRVDVRSGQRLVVEIEGVQLGYDLNNLFFDPFIAILDDQQNELASSDDSSLRRQDGVCCHVAQSDQTLTVVVRDSSFGGHPSFAYRLHVGDYPRPVAIYPGGGTPGSVLSARWIDIDGSSATTDIQLPSESSSRWDVSLRTEHAVSPTPNGLRVNELPVTLETEPNDNHRMAPQHTVPAAFCGIIEKPDDFDCFAFECVKGTKYRVEVFAREVLRSELDAVLNVFGPDGNVVQSSDDNAGKMDPLVEFSAAVDGPHTIRLYDHLRGGGDRYQYRIEVTPATPSLALELNELRRDEATPALAPIGGNGAIMVTAKRGDYGGPVDLSLTDLPAGMTATTFPLPAGYGEIPVLLSAAPDSVVAATLFDITGTADTSQPGLSGQVDQTHKLVLGQNRLIVLTHLADRPAAAIVDPVPFSIELLQPATPILRDGSKDLTVRLVRHEGFDGPVYLTTLYNPPGVAINNSREIAKDQTEATIPMTANGGAAIGDWPLIINARYQSPSGDRFLASNAISLGIQSQAFGFSFGKAAGEIGQTISVNVGLEVLTPLNGEAEVELVGLPAGVTSTAAVQRVTADSTSVVFPITLTADAKAGTHKTLVCIARIRRDGEVISQTAGTGELRIDTPPPQVTTPDPAAVAAPPPAPAEAAPKPLSRLEQLRQQQQAASQP